MNIAKITTKRPDGFILITVLCTIVLLTALLLEFNYAARTHLEETGDFADNLKALNNARSGLSIALATLQKNPDLQSNQTLRQMSSDQLTVDLKTGTCTIKVRTENGKLNLNLLKNKNGQPDRPRIDQMLQLIDLLNQRLTNRDHITYSIVPAIIDWIDTDNDITILPFVKANNRGAEAGYYLSCQPAINCSNRPLNSIDQLLTVKGIGSSLLYETPIPDRHGNIIVRGLHDLLTVYGDGKVDINRAPALVIQALAGDLTPQAVDLIIQKRNAQPFTSLAELKTIPGLSSSLYAQLAKYATCAPRQQYYKISSAGKAGSSNCVIEAIICLDSVTGSVRTINYKETE